MRRKFALMTVACLLVFNGMFTNLYPQADVVWTYYVQDFWYDSIGETKISPDSKYIAMIYYHAGDSAAFRLLNISDGSIYKDIIRNDTNYATHLLWVNDSLVATSHYDNSIIKIWNINTGNVDHSFNDSGLNLNHGWTSSGITYCNSGKLFIPFSNDSTYLGDRGKWYFAFPFDSVMVINTNTWQIERKFRTNSLIRLAENCSYYLEDAYYDNKGVAEFSYKFNDVETDSLLWHFDPPDHRTRSDEDLGISPNGRYLIYSLSDTIIRTIDFLNKTYNDSKLNWASDYFGSMSFQYNSNRFLAIGTGTKYNYEYSIFDINSTNPIYTFYDSTFARTTEASRDSQYVLACNRKSLRLFHINWNPTMIKEKDKEEPNYIYPNPSSGLINIPILSKANDITVEIYNTNCALIKSELVEDGNIEFYQLNVSDLISGSYQIIVRYDDKISTYKTIINK